MPITTSHFHVPPTGSRFPGMDARNRRLAGPAPSTVQAQPAGAPEHRSALPENLEGIAPKKETSVEPAAGTGTSETASFSFLDLIDIINPLHHIPVIGTIYRALSGDEIKAPARVLGGGIFGGLAGAASGMLNTVLDKITGKDLGEHLMALFNIDEADPADKMAAGNGTNPLIAVHETTRSTGADAASGTGGLPELTYHIARETGVSDPWEKGARGSLPPLHGSLGNHVPGFSERMPAMLAQAIEHYDQAGRIKNPFPEDKDPQDRRRLDLFY